jgi:hypothetical protein
LINRIFFPQAALKRPCLHPSIPAVITTARWAAFRISPSSAPLKAVNQGNLKTISAETLFSKRLMGLMPVHTVV